MDTRNCGECGQEFRPKREHGKFCSARCRVAWNRAHADGLRPDTRNEDEPGLWDATLQELIDELRERLAGLEVHEGPGGYPSPSSLARLEGVTIYSMRGSVIDGIHIDPVTRNEDES
jgi:hypothetical protein